MGQGSKIDSDRRHDYFLKLTCDMGEIRDRDIGTSGPPIKGPLFRLSVSLVRAQSVHNLLSESTIDYPVPSPEQTDQPR